MAALCFDETLRLTVISLGYRLTSPKSPEGGDQYLFFQTKISMSCLCTRIVVGLGRVVFV